MAWEKFEDEAGRSYYHNAETGETSWDRPPSFGANPILKQKSDHKQSSKDKDRDRDRDRDKSRDRSESSSSDGEGGGKRRKKRSEKRQSKHSSHSPKPRQTTKKHSERELRKSKSLRKSKVS